MADQTISYRISLWPALFLSHIAPKLWELLRTGPPNLWPTACFPIYFQCKCIFKLIFIILVKQNSTFFSDAAFLTHVKKISYIIPGTSEASASNFGSVGYAVWSFQVRHFNKVLLQNPSIDFIYIQLLWQKYRSSQIKNTEN